MLSGTASRLLEEANPVALVPGRQQDFEFLQSLHRQVMREHVERAVGWHEEEQAARLRRHFHPASFFRIELGGLPIGTLSLKYEGDALRLEQFYLLARWQGRGIGSLVLRQVMEGARWQRRPIRLSVLLGSPARRLYERAGFQWTGADRWEDHLFWAPEEI